MAAQLLSRIARGEVMHRRHQPVRNFFQYPVFFLLINCDELEQLDSWLFGINRARLLGFHFADHGDGRDPRCWVRERLQEAGITDCDGPLWVQTFPRVLGYVFNPVSFWYCQRSDGSTGAILVEVNNTFGDRHCYLLGADPSTGAFRDLRADKRFFVSPFYPVEGWYRFGFTVNLNRPSAQIDYYQQTGLQLSTAIWGRTVAFSRGQLLKALLAQPFLTFGVIIKIHWQALRLWRKGLPLFKRPLNTNEDNS